MTTEQRSRPGINRRALLGSAAGALPFLVTGCGTKAPLVKSVTPRAASDRSLEFHGRHQGGITTPQQKHVQLAAFDLVAEDAQALNELLRAWSDAAAGLTRGVAGETGEAAGLGAAGLTVTFGLGPGLFEREGEDRLGLLGARPAALAPLPTFKGDQLEERRSGGDLCIQVCADDAQVAFDALHTLVRTGAHAATPRWVQAGFASRPNDGGTGRNLMGFKDGTGNVSVTDPRALAKQVWAEPSGWMRDGTYLVVRRVRILLDVWDATSVEQQERAVGRYKISGAPLGGRREHDALDLEAQRDGAPAIPANAHVRLAAATTNGGAQMLRRSYSYSDGMDTDTGQVDAGLLFLSFQRDPDQFVRIQRALAESDALSKHLAHTGSGVFAIPPGARKGGFVGETLFHALR